MIDSNNVIIPPPIPSITSPDGRGWQNRQPDPSEIMVLPDKVIMTTATFKKLAEYSASQPTGLYAGKMWRRNDAVAARYNGYYSADKWFLYWVTPSTKPPDKRGSFVEVWNRPIELAE